MFNIHKYYDYLFELRTLQFHRKLSLAGRLAQRGFKLTTLQVHIIFWGPAEVLYIHSQTQYCTDTMLLSCFNAKAIKSYINYLTD